MPDTIRSQGATEVLGKLHKQKEPEDRSSIPAGGQWDPRGGSSLAEYSKERRALEGGNSPLHGMSESAGDYQTVHMT